MQDDIAGSHNDIQELKFKIETKAEENDVQDILKRFKDMPTK